MVFFSCDGCAEMLKKSQVDNHANRCRSCASVSCVDCNVQFFGDDYRAHTSCMTEAERYEGKAVTKTKKRSPQDAWMDLVAESVSKSPKHLRNHLQTIVSLSNLPRKEKPFRNFVANSVKGLSSSTTAELWTFLQSLRTPKAPETKRIKENAVDVNENDISPTKANTPAVLPVEKDVPKIKETTKKPVETPLDKKAVKKTMKKLLKKKKSMSVKKLHKSVRAQFGALDKRIVKDIVKKALAGSKTFRLEEGTVSLCS